MKEAYIRNVQTNPIHRVAFLPLSTVATSLTLLLMLIDIKRSSLSPYYIFLPLPLYFPCNKTTQVQ